MEHTENVHRLIGNVGAKSPGVTVLAEGGPDTEERIRVTFNLATSESWTDRKTGERRSHVEWHRVSITDQVLARYAQRAIRPGDEVMICGKIRTRSFKDKEGGNRTITETCVEPNLGHRVHNFDHTKERRAAENSQATEHKPESATTTAPTTAASTTDAPAAASPTPTTTPEAAGKPAVSTTTAADDDGARDPRTLSRPAVQPPATTPSWDIDAAHDPRSPNAERDLSDLDDEIPF